MNQLLQHPGPVLAPPDDLYLDPKIIDGKRLLNQAGHAHGIFFRGEDTGYPPPFAAFEKTIQFPFGIAVVVGETLSQLKLYSKPTETLLETLGGGDGRKGARPETLEFFEGKDFSCGKILQLHRVVATLEDGCGPVVFPDPLDQCGNVAPITFRDQDMGSSTEMFRRFAKSASRKKVLVAKRGFAVNQHQIEPSVQFEILKSIVQNE